MNAVAKLSMVISGRAAKANLTITNTSAQDVYLEKYKVFNDGEVENNCFKITAGEQHKIRYIGKMVKRRGPTPQDFLKLGPGEQYERTVDLTKAYEFLPGTHNYRIFYTALHGYPSDPDGLWELRSDDVVFTLTH